MQRIIREKTQKDNVVFVNPVDVAPGLGIGILDECGWPSDTAVLSSSKKVAWLPRSAPGSSTGVER